MQTYELRAKVEGLSLAQNEATEKAEKILKTAEKNNREFSDEEDAEFNRLMKKVESLGKQIDFHKIDLNKRNKSEMQQARKIQDRFDNGELRISGSDVASGKRRVQDANGNAFVVFNRGERVSDYSFGGSFDADCEFPMGEICKAMLNGPSRSTPGEIRNMMAESSNASGGVLVPIEFSSLVVDKARARSVLAQTGMTTFMMESDAHQWAKVETDPTFEAKKEGEAFGETQVTFSGKAIHPHTIGCVITASRELAADAPNFAQLIEGVLSRSLAAQIDWYGVQGTGNNEPTGLVSMSGIEETGSVGAIAWEDVSSAALAVRLNNHEPNAWIAHPNIMHDLLMLTTGDGTNSAKGWLPAPPTLEGLTRASSTNVPTGNVVVGDYTNLVLGLRQGALIETSTTAGDSFRKHEWAIKITWRGDFATLDESAFHRLAGVTT